MSWQKIQDHVIYDGDQDETSSADEKPPASESIPSSIGSSREPLEQLATTYTQSETSTPYGRSF